METKLGQWKLKAIVKDGIRYPVKEKKSSRKKSWITLNQIMDEYPEFWDKLLDILFSKGDEQYWHKSIDYAKSILDFICDWEWISWKQFDSIMMIVNNKEKYNQSYIDRNRRMTRYKDMVAYKGNSVGFTFIDRDGELANLIKYSKTDKDIDKLHEKIFGHRPMFEEEIAGYSISYREDGSRFFSLPTTDLKLSDFIF